jgi:hypothetical protein
VKQSPQLEEFFNFFLGFLFIDQVGRLNVKENIRGKKNKWIIIEVIKSNLKNVVFALTRNSLNWVSKGLRT